jgi:hypothetical protein
VSRQLTRQRHELLGVLVRRRETADYRVVTSALGLEIHASKRNPHERMRPVGGTGDLSESLGRPVGAAHMLQFVTKYAAQLLFAPFYRGLWKKNRGASEAERDRDIQFAGNQYFKVAPHSKLATQPVCQSNSCDRYLGPGAEPADAPESRRERSHERNRDEQISRSHKGENSQPGLCGPCCAGKRLRRVLSRRRSNSGTRGLQLSARRCVSRRKRNLHYVRRDEGGGNRK